MTAPTSRRPGSPLQSEATRSLIELHKPYTEYRPGHLDYGVELCSVDGERYPCTAIGLAHQATRQEPPMTRVVQRSTPRNGKPNPHREEALDRLRAGTPAASVAAWAGVHRSTVTRWARASGIDPGTNTERTRAATAARAAQLTAATVERLEYLIELASTGLIRRLEANADAAELSDTDLGDWSNELGRFLPANAHAAAVMRRYDHIRAGEPTRDLSTALSRGIHDLALLRGAESGTLIVRFGIPRPTEPAEITENVDTDA